MSDLINRADAIEAVANGYCSCVSDCVDEIKKLSSSGTDCTGFIDWIRKVVADEELWELNAAGYGEIICRKLVKIGALATTEKPPYYYVPSADDECKYEHYPIVRCKDCEYADFNSPYPVCNLLEMNINEDGYCSWGKMKGGDDE